jgi:hypothetical protein
MLQDTLIEWFFPKRSFQGVGRQIVILLLWSEPKLGAHAAENSSFRGGEEILKYDGVTLNAGRGLNPATGIFLAPQVG